MITLLLIAAIDLGVGVVIVSWFLGSEWKNNSTKEKLKYAALALGMVVAQALSLAFAQHLAGL